MGFASFCTACGARLTRTSPARPLWEPAAEARLVACPRCGASNAASRVVCGICGGGLDEAAPVGVDEPDPVPAAAPPEPRHAAPRALLLATTVGGLVLFAALLFLSSARGFGPFATAAGEPSPAPGAARPVRVVEARASSALPPRSATGPQRAVDGDPATAWNEAAPGDGTGEWLELTLAEPVDVTRLLVWNGWQRSGAVFVDNNRVQMLRIRAGGRTYTVRLLDRQGPLAVNLPEPVRTRRVRLQVRSVYPGERYDDGAISEVRVEALPTARTPRSAG